MPRGITEDDVWKACDALLLEGARPTIERVRLKLGRGSPNTVSPFLETWFKHLGGRIKDPGAFASPADVPDLVMRAAKHFWEAALAETRRDFDERLRDGLSAAVANVEAEKERAAQANAAAFEATGKVARLQAELVDREALLQEQRAAREKTEAQLVESRAQVEELRSRLDAAHMESASLRDQSQRAIAEAIDRFAAAERRAALEIDSERTARSKAERRAEAFERRLDDMRTELRELQKHSVGERDRLEAYLLRQRTDAATREEAMQARIEVLAKQLADAERDNAVARARGDLAEGFLASVKRRRKKRTTAARSNDDTSVPGALPGTD